MRQIKNALLLLSVVFCSAGSRSYKTSKVETRAENGILLEYIGNMSGMMSMSIGIQVEIDTTIGFRYEVTFERGASVLGHTAIFYKFSAPHQTIIYNFLDHRSYVNKENKENGSDAKVVVIGKATIDSFVCTHLQHTNTDEVSDYWMSQNVPGFSQLTSAVNNISPGLMNMAISGTIFQWGGLVRMVNNYSNGKGNVHVDLKLQEASTGLDLPASDFDVPSK